MKFRIKLSFIVTTVIIICSLAVALEIKEQNKRSESMMEFMNGFFATGKNKEQTDLQKSMNNHKKKSHHGNKKHASHYRFKEGANETNSSSTNSTNVVTVSNLTVSKENIASSIEKTTSPILQDWFMISSPALKNTKKFPPVKLNDGREIIIRVDPEFFRVNEAFNNTTGNDKPPSDRFFWFRLSGLNIYYSLTKSDINILGAVAIREISNIVKLSDNQLNEGKQAYCFTVTDTEGSMWKICGIDEKNVLKWVCQIKLLLGQKEFICKPFGQDDDKKNITIVEKNITQPIIVIPMPSPQCNDGWNYQKFGIDWECDCSEGKEQSPIDLPSVFQAIESPVKPLFQYDEVASISKVSTIEGQLKENETLKIKLVENSLRIFHNRFGKVVTMDGAVYYAQEIVIHTPAEHTIEGKTYDMEVQIIHYGMSVGDIAKQVILSFVFEKTPGVYNKFLDDLDIFNLPNPLSKERELNSNIFIPKIFYSADDTGFAGMKPFSFYTYQGSITAPPCTENTIMYVASKPLPIGSTALHMFEEALRIPDVMNTDGNILSSNWITINNRKPQPLNGRPVFHYDHQKYCGRDPVNDPDVIRKPKGHYEKVLKAQTNYFYVNGESPSGIPNAFVVGENEALGN